ncbi:phage tail terminator-like protein [Teichococcus aestuarii]
MSSPQVWDDARARIELGAAQLGLSVAWPNEQFQEPAPFSPDGGVANLWIAVSIRGDLSEPYEIEGGIWEETGTVEVHVMLPATAGIRPGLLARKALANLFRG